MRQIKVCSKCNETKLLSEFYKRGDTGNYRWSCKACHKIARQRNYREKKEDYQRRNRRWAHKWRMSALEVLGGVCVHCGFDDWRALEIDHIDGTGAQARKEMRSHKMHKLIAEGLTENYQILCANCNQIKKRQQLGFVGG